MLGLAQGLQCICSLGLSRVKQCPFCAQSRVREAKGGMHTFAERAREGAGSERKREEAEGVHPTPRSQAWDRCHISCWRLKSFLNLLQRL